MDVFFILAYFSTKEMTQTSFKNTKEHLTCVTCLKFNNAPLLLSCKHSLCKTCIISSYDESKYIYNVCLTCLNFSCLARGTIKCLICGQIDNKSLKEIDKLQRGVFVNNIYHSFEGLDLLFKLRPTISNYWVLENNDIIFVDDGNLFVKFGDSDIIEGIDKESGVQIRKTWLGRH